MHKICILHEMDNKWNQMKSIHRQSRKINSLTKQTIYYEANNLIQKRKKSILQV